MHTIAASPNPDSDLPALEATAKERGVFVEDKLHWGTEWRLVLLQRLDNQAYCKQQEQKVNERSERPRAAGRNPCLFGSAVAVAR